MIVMKFDRSNTERGATIGEVLFVLAALAVFVLIVVLILTKWGNSPSTAATQHPAVAKLNYHCETTKDGLIPLKAVIAVYNGAPVYREASANSASGERLPMFESFFSIHEQGSFVELAGDPFSGKSIGWVERKHVILWATREAIKPNRGNPSRRLTNLWRRVEDVGREDKITFVEDPENDPPNPYPVLEAKNRSYHIAVPWQSEDFERVGVSTGWTDHLEVPDDVHFYYLITRTDLQHDLERLDDALLQLRSGPHAAHPIVSLLRGTAHVTVGEGIDDSSGDPTLIRRILRQLRNPLSITEKQPADIKQEGERMRLKLSKLRRFYNDQSNFNARGIGWVAREDLPAN